MALNFNGTSQYVNIPGSSSLDCPTDDCNFGAMANQTHKPLIGKDLHPLSLLVNSSRILNKSE